jgi:hypothetical protein
MTRVSDFLSGASPTPSPTAEAPPSATPAPSASPVASEPEGQAGKKTVKQARAASENAAVAAKEAASASAAATLAAKQAASVANRIGGSGPSNADVSLESNPAPAAAGSPIGAIANRPTPASSPSLTTSDARDASVVKMTPTMGSSALEPSGLPQESNPAKAAKLIESVDRIEKRVDRKNLTADDSQRDILAQRLLQEANKALAGHDSVAAISLATKASTLLEPLPKLADSSIPPAP